MSTKEQNPQNNNRNIRFLTVIEQINIALEQKGSQEFLSLGH